jgi:hypothetical protein
MRARARGLVVDAHAPGRVHPVDHRPAPRLALAPHDHGLAAALAVDERAQLGQVGESEKLLPRRVDHRLDGRGVGRQDRSAVRLIGAGALLLRGPALVVLGVNHDDLSAAAEEQLVRRGPEFLLAIRLVVIGPAEPRVVSPCVLRRLVDEHARDARREGRGRAWVAVIVLGGEVAEDAGLLHPHDAGSGARREHVGQLRGFGGRVVHRPNLSLARSWQRRSASCAAR